MLFQEKLKELRKSKNISQYELASALNISRSVIAKWETGLTLPTEESITLLMEYFNVTRQELFNNEETESIIVEKNSSISKLKKLILILLISLSVLLVTLIIIVISISPESLSKEIDKLGDLDKVKIGLIDNVNEKKYYLDSSENNIKNNVLQMLNDAEYKVYPNNMIVEKHLGQYTIVLNGDIDIYINTSYLRVDNEQRAIKEWTSQTIEQVIKILISSECIQVLEENQK